MQQHPRDNDIRPQLPPKGDPDDLIFFEEEYHVSER